MLDLSALWPANLAYYRTDAVKTVTVIGDGNTQPSSDLAPPEEAWCLKVVRRAGGVEAFETGPESIDTVVSAFSLCCLDGLDALFDRVLRWLAPGGRVLLLEHVRAPGTIGLLQWALTPLERMVADGCRLDVDVTGSLRRAGLVTGDCARFRLPGAGPLAVPCIAVVARARRHPPEERAA